MNSESYEGKSTVLCETLRLPKLMITSGFLTFKTSQTNNLLLSARTNQIWILKINPVEISNLTQGYKLLGFHSDAVKVSIILGCDAMSLGNWCLTFQDSMVVCLIFKDQKLQGLTDPWK